VGYVGASHAPNTQSHTSCGGDKIDSQIQEKTRCLKMKNLRLALALLSSGFLLGASMGAFYMLINIWSAPVYFLEANKPFLAFEIGAVLFGLAGFCLIVLPEVSRNRWALFREVQEV